MFRRNLYSESIAGISDSVSRKRIGSGEDNMDQVRKRPFAHLFDDIEGSAINSKLWLRAHHPFRRQRGHIAALTAVSSDLR
jgi:hypothetical protein